MLVAQSILAVLSIYLLTGLVFGFWFIWFGAYRLDDAAKGASIGFRLVILPGATLLWPILILKLLNGSTTQETGKTHKGTQLLMWLILAPIIAMGFVAALNLRQIDPVNDVLPTVGLEEDDR